MNNFNELFRQMSASVVTAMYEDHAENLGVDSCAIEQLPAGFDYKYQAWVYPERDPRGNIIGLSYRYRDGRKTMAPGLKNKRGLIYPFNQSFARGTERYEPGRHNFRRVGDVGVGCPICGKPDWCLVSSDDITDPQAVICARVEEGSVKKQGDSGWLHVRKPKGRISKAAKRVLPDTDKPILIVEGASDVFAGLSLGYITIGRPNNKAHPMLTNMPLAGREIWIIGENDAGAGKEGMDDTFSLLKTITPNIKRVMPPEGVKDLRAWYIEGITPEGLAEYVVKNCSSDVCEADPDVLSNGEPATMSRAFIAQRYTYKKTDSCTLHSYRDDWYEWEEAEYRRLPISALRGEIYEYLEGHKYIHQTANGGVVRPCPTTRRVAYDVLDCLNMPSLTPVRKQFPCWVRDIGMPDPKDLIIFRNGMLDVNKYMEGKICLYDPSPDLFVMHTFPYDYDEDVECTEIEQYFKHIHNGDDEVIRLLAQWFGYNSVPDTTYEKMMMLIGPPRSGKSTTVDILRGMLGDEQCCSISMAHLSSRFGRANLVGRLAATMSDAHSPRGSEASSALDTLLAIVGQDPVSIDRKFVEELTNVRLFSRFTIAMNSLPEFSDHSRALAPKILSIKFPNSYIGREDIKLKPRLVAQAKQGKLINWALRGLRDLRNNGVFVQPLSSIMLHKQIEASMTPALRFLKDCCLEGPRYNVPKNKLFKIFTAWCEAENQRPCTRNQFARWITDASPGARYGRRRGKNGEREYTIDGVKPTPTAIKDYL